jgi:long-chain acyl-CoA synthetase
LHDRPWYASWPAGLRVSLDYPIVPVWKILESSAKTCPDRAAMIFQIGGGVTTYAELWDKTRRLAAALARLGVRKGDRVAVQLPNSPQFAFAYYGALLAGATVSPCNALLASNELRHQLTDSGAETLITLDLFMGTAGPIRYATALKRIIVSGVQEILTPPTPVDVKPYGGKTYSLYELVADTPDDPPKVKIDPERDLAHLAYTGGTSGTAKGVMLTHQAVVTNTLQIAHWAAGGRPVLGDDGLFSATGASVEGGGASGLAESFPVRLDGARVMCVVPWAHAMGVIGYLNVPAYLGMTMVVHPRFDPAAYVADIAERQVEVFGGAPAVLQGVADLPGVESVDFSAVRWIPSGAAPLLNELQRRIESLVPGAIVMEAYGLTETTMAATANPANRSGWRKPGSVGFPLFDSDVKIVDLDDPDLEIDFDELGEICLAGPQVMVGYWKRPEETAATLRNGWIHTGDIGRLDSDGYLYVVDRKKDMLIYNGYNVYPREIEEILRSHRAVDQCAVIGKNDPRVGEYPKAFVVRRPGVTVTEAELIAFVASRVAPYKKVRELEFIDAIPLSPAGKPLKRMLKERENAGPEGEGTGVK